MLAEKTNSQSQGYKQIKTTRASLSKRFLLRVQDGKYIVSNLFTQGFQPIFAETAAPLAGRQEQWRRIVDAGADQKLCSIFNNKNEADECIQAMRDRASELIDLETGVRYRTVQLKKAVFMALSEGMPLVSCAFYLNGRPRFYEETSPKPERGEQWKQIVKAGIGRIKCFVFHSQADMQDFFGHRGLFNTLQEAA